MEMLLSLDKSIYVQNEKFIMCKMKNFSADFSVVIVPFFILDTNMSELKGCIHLIHPF